MNTPEIIYVHPRPEKQLVQGLRRNLNSTWKKMKPWIAVTKKMYAYDAISSLLGARSKAAEMIANTIKQTLNHAKCKGYREERMFIHGIMVGRQRRFKQVRYHGRARHGTLKRNIVQLRVILEHKPLDQMYKLMLNGKTPAAMAYLIRSQLIDDDQNYDKILKYQFALTSKGKQQQKLMIKREAMRRWLKFKEEGRLFSKEYL